MTETCVQCLGILQLLLWCLTSPQDLGESPQASGMMKIQMDTQLSSCLKTNTHNPQALRAQPRVGDSEFLSCERLAQWAQQDSPKKVRNPPQDRVRKHPGGPTDLWKGHCQSPGCSHPRRVKKSHSSPSHDGTVGYTAGDRSQLHMLQSQRPHPGEGDVPTLESRMRKVREGKVRGGDGEGKDRGQTPTDGQQETQSKTRHPRLSLDSGTQLATWDTNPRPSRRPGQRKEAASRALSCLHPALQTPKMQREPPMSSG